MADQLSKAQLKRKDGSKVDASELKEKVLAFYFSAHWCPPCRMFTPELKDFYEAANKENRELELVFFSFDRSDDDALEYVNEAHGNWCYLLPSDPVVEEMSTKYSVEGIPQLIVLNGADGKILSNNGRGDVSGASAANTLAKWKAAI